MAAMTPLRIPKVAFSLTLFWGFILTVFFRDYFFNFKFFVALVPATLLGIWLAELDSEALKNYVLDKLRYNREKNLPTTDFNAFKNEDRGLFSHLGPLPFHVENLPQLEAIDQEILSKNCPQEIQSGLKFIEQFVADYKDTHPAHVNLFLALLRVYSHEEHEWLPAGIDSHKGRSLLTHSLLVCSVALSESKTYEPTPPSSRRLAPLDPNYKPNKQDPLIGILTLAHDLGKIASFNVKDGVVVSIDPNHDTMGARLIARIPEYWDTRIDAEDRRIIHAVMAFYHHPSEIPVQSSDNKNGFPKVLSDRQHYLLDLLIHADLMAGSIENGKSYQEAQETSEDIASLVTAGDTAPLFTRFLDFMTRVGVSAKNGKSVAFKYCDDTVTNGRTYLYFDQKEFLTQFITFTGSKVWTVESANSKLHEITKIIMKELDSEGYLARLGEDYLTARAAETCLYKVEFWNKKTPDAPTIVLSNCFVMDATDCKELSFVNDITNNKSEPRVVSNSMGFAGQKNQPKGRSAIDEATEAELRGTEVQQIGTGLMELALQKAKQPILSQSKKHLKRAIKARDEIAAILNSPQVDIASTIQVLDTIDKGLVVVGLESILQNSVILFEATKTPNEILREVGIIEISPRKSVPGTFVFVIDKALLKSV